MRLRLCDPACGSGHFLLAAARHLGKELAHIRSGQDEPAPEAIRAATRDVITHCLYGVDKNPLAVDLCKVALWIEGHAEGKPLTFLDHRIRCGDSLVGVLDLDALRQGIPDDAFDPVSGDDKATARSLKRRNREERAGQLGLLFDAPQPLHELAEAAQQLDQLPDDSPDLIRRKQQLYHSIRHSPLATRQLTAANLWTAAFFQRIANGERRTVNSSSFITTAALADWLAGRPIDASLTGSANAMARQLRFFHWPLEFPEVFANGEERTANGASEQPFAIRHSPFAPQAGFDLILGNPPWERIKLQEQEFFATRDPRIAAAPNKAARQRLIDDLPRTNPALAAEFARAKHEHEAASKFVRASDRFPLTARGDINTYALFAELARRLLAPDGRAGIIVPTGIATDDTCKTFFADLNERRALVSLFDFENREGLFPAVDSRMKFCLLTLRGVEEANGERPAANSEQRMANGKQAKPPADHSPLATRHSPPAEFAFFLTRAEQLRDVRRRFSLAPEDLALLNPNTRTCPVFRTRADAELTRAIYRRVPVLVREANGEQRMANGVKPPAGHSPLATRYSPSANPWGVSFLRMIDMANDSHLFRTREQLEQDGFRLVGNAFVKGDPHSPLAIRYSPLYEAKMIWQFDHRWATYEKGETRDCTEAEKQDPHFTVRPRYWVAEGKVEDRLELWNADHTRLLWRWERDWLLGFRDITNATNERTAIFSLLPRVGVNHKAPLLLTESAVAAAACLLANLNAVVLDFCARQKVGGTSLGFFILKQLPVLPPSAYSEADLAFIVPRVVELVYTAWDLQPFAADILAEIGPDTWNRWFPSHPLPLSGSHALPHPFAWDEPRRALLRAELDAYFARLYGLTRKQLRYILDPADLTPRELENILDPWEEVADPLDPAGYAARCAASDFPGETFRVLKEKELARWGEYRTRRLVLEAWERLRRPPSR